MSMAEDPIAEVDWGNRDEIDSDDDDESSEGDDDDDSRAGSDEEESDDDVIDDAMVERFIRTFCNDK
jgi:hypothetical protein